MESRFIFNKSSLSRETMLQWIGTVTIVLAVNVVSVQAMEEEDQTTTDCRKSAAKNEFAWRSQGTGENRNVFLGVCRIEYCTQVYRNYGLLFTGSVSSNWNKVLLQNVVYALTDFHIPIY